MKNELIYKIVKSIPIQKVMSYGQIAELVPGCTARMVGHAMAVLPDNLDVPWWRVVNAQLKISRRADGNHHILQRKLLEKENIVFNTSGKISEKFRYKL